MKEIKLDQKQAQRFTDALDNPPEPSEKLREAFMDYYETNGGILGCLPGETPASIVLLQQEQRHRATLAARDAEIVKLKECVEHFSQAALDRLHEIERLKARIATLEGAMKADEDRLVEAAKLGGVGYFGCDTPEVMADTIGGLREQLRLANVDAAENEADANDLSAEIAKLKALVEKRERQLVWALRACSDDEALKFHGLDIIALSDDDAGLLAAIDEATREKPDPR